MIQIPDPCNEDWSKMKIVREGRHCLSCTKTVVDFTKMERFEIIEYLLLNKDKSVCGHINKSMLDFDVEELYLTVQRAESIKHSSNLAFCILSMGALFLASCSNETTSTKDHSGYTRKGMLERIEVPKETKKESNKTENTTISNKKNCNNETNIGFIAQKVSEIESTENIKIEEKTVDGEIGFYYDDPPQAEYPGGFSALKKYLTENLKIPESVSESGKVYVKIFIKEDGSVGKVYFLKSYSEDENLKAEINRVISSMPNWIPAKVNGKNVNSYMNLPISINLSEKQ